MGAARTNRSSISCWMKQTHIGFAGGEDPLYFLPLATNYQRRSWILAALRAICLSIGGARCLSSQAQYAHDGIPDFLRLDDPADQESFRRWFSFLAEVQYFNSPKSRPPEIVDCAALIRYAYREALRLHDSAWAVSAHLPLIPAIASIRKYNYPHTPIGAALFRICDGPYVSTDLKSGAFAQFANAETIQRFNTFFIGRDVGHARAGDLLFYRRETDRVSFHSMIFVGRSEIDQRSNMPVVVYDTGPTDSRKGEIRRLSLEELLRYPDAQWQPRASNPVFLGVFRWNILKLGR